MGQPNCVNRNYSSKDGSKPGEVKHFSTQRKINRRDSVSSGERKRNSPNLFLLAIIKTGVIGENIFLTNGSQLTTNDRNVVGRLL